MDNMFITAALASAEKIINAALAYDPATRIALGKLEPQILAVQINEPDVKIFIAPTANGIRLLGYYESEVTTQVQGTAPALLSLIKSDRLNLKDTGVNIFGSTSFLSDLQNILKNLDIDWEEMLSQIFGDIVGHQSAEFIRGKISWVKDRTSNIQRLTSEFLTEELRALPSKPELAYFNQQVDELRLGVDRIEARVEQLLARTQAHQQE